MKLSKAHTACYGCKFCKYDGDTQTGCDYGVVEGLQSSGLVIEAENEHKKFYILNEKLCALKRNEGYPDRDPRDDLSLVYHYLIDHKNDDDTVEILNKLKEEKYQPKELTIVLKMGGFIEAKAILKAVANTSGYSIKKELIDRPFADAIHETLLNSKCPYYITNETGKWAGHEGFTEKLMDHIIYSPPFTYVDLKNGYLALSSFHKILSSNNIVEKLDLIWQNKSIGL